MQFVYCFIGFFLFSFYTVNCESYKEIMDTLLRCAETDDLETMKEILESNENLLNKGGEEGMTLLHVAAMEGSVDVIKYLVEEQHVDVDMTNERTPLWKAFKGQQVEAFKLLLELGADPYKARVDGISLLHQAANASNVELLKVLLPYFNVDVRYNFGETPAYTAAREGKLDALRFLLENGADPYARTEFNETLMHAAVKSNQISVVKELIRYKELINSIDVYKNPPIDTRSTFQIVKELVNAGAYITDLSIWRYLTAKRHNDILKYLVAESGKFDVSMPPPLYEDPNCRATLLWELIRNHYPFYDIIEFVVEQGADVNFKNCYKLTPVHWAAVYNGKSNLQIIKLLLDKGADINAQSVDGRTPLDMAVERKKNVTAEYLRKFGAYSKMDKSNLFRAAESNDLKTLKQILESNKNLLNERVKEGMTLLHIAAIGGSVDVIKYLVEEQHADINIISSISKGSTPLSEAVEAGQLESVKLLLELGADKDIKSRYDDITLLHQAAEANNVELLKFLLPYFNVDVRNAVGETPAYLAAKHGKLDALRFLLENGADPYTRGSNNRTLMHAAVSSKHVDVVKDLSRYKELINLNDSYNSRPIDLVSDMQVVKELVTAGANITDQSIWNYLEMKEYDIFKYLVVKSDKVNVRITWDNRDCRETLLMHLLNQTNLQYDVIEFILKQGADVNMKDCSNITALHRAAGRNEENTLQIIKLLLDRGVDINAADSNGLTPLDYATAGKNQDVVEFLRNAAVPSQE